MAHCMRLAEQGALWPMTAQRSILVIIAATHRDAPIGAPSVICQAATAPASDEAVPPALLFQRSTAQLLRLHRRQAPAREATLAWPEGCLRRSCGVWNSQGAGRTAACIMRPASLPGRSPLTGGTSFRGSRWSNARPGSPPPAWLCVAWRGCRPGCARITCTALPLQCFGSGGMAGHGHLAGGLRGREAQVRGVRAAHGGAVPEEALP